MAHDQLTKDHDEMLGETDLLNFHLTSWGTIRYIGRRRSHTGSTIAIDAMPSVARLGISMRTNGGIGVRRHDLACQMLRYRVVESSQPCINRLYGC
jgi:hypothetical protein